MTPANKDWMTHKELAEYSRLSTRQISRAIVQPFNNLPSHLVMGRRLFLKSEYDDWATGRGVQKQARNRKSDTKSSRRGRKAAWSRLGIRSDVKTGLSVATTDNTKNKTPPESSNSGGE